MTILCSPLASYMNQSRTPCTTHLQTTRAGSRVLRDQTKQVSRKGSGGGHKNPSDDPLRKRCVLSGSDGRAIEGSASEPTDLSRQFPVRTRWGGNTLLEGKVVYLAGCRTRRLNLPARINSCLGSNCGMYSCACACVFAVLPKLEKFPNLTHSVLRQTDGGQWA